MQETKVTDVQEKLTTITTLTAQNTETEAQRDAAARERDALAARLVDSNKLIKDLQGKIEANQTQVSSVAKNFT